MIYNNKSIYNLRDEYDKLERDIINKKYTSVLKETRRILPREKILDISDIPKKSMQSIS